MNKNGSKTLSLLRVTLNGEELMVNNVFVTGDAIAFWQAEKHALIDLVPGIGTEIWSGKTQFT